MDELDTPGAFELVRSCCADLVDNPRENGFGLVQGLHGLFRLVPSPSFAVRLAAMVALASPSMDHRSEPVLPMDIRAKLLKMLPKCKILPLYCGGFGVSRV